MLWFCPETFCVPDKCFPVCTAQETSWATMCPRLPGPLAVVPPVQLVPTYIVKLNPQACMAGPRVNKMCCLGGYVGEVYTTTCWWCHRPPPPPPTHAGNTSHIYSFTSHRGKTACEKYIMQHDCCSFLSFCRFLNAIYILSLWKRKLKYRWNRKLSDFFGQVEINQQEKRKVFTTQSVIGRNVAFDQHYQKVWTVLSCQTVLERDT